jgi:SAM-dependent methyltransferase
LLRRLAIGHRRRTLDLGAGYGAVTSELARRASGPVFALDRDWRALRSIPAAPGHSGPICALAQHLPLPSASLDLVFTQFSLLWMNSLAAAVGEIARVLRPGGALAAIEPDYGGMIESPDAIATLELWLAALRRAGAEPLAGRRLVPLLTSAGFDLHVGLLDELATPSPARFDMLAGLPLTEDERRHVAAARAAEAGLEPWGRLAHLPVFLIAAIKR